MQTSTIPLDVMNQVLQEKSIRPRIKILLNKGYLYSDIESALGCSSKTISSVKKLMSEDKPIIKIKTGPKVKITEEVKDIVLEENFLHPDMCLRELSLYLEKEKGISIKKTSIDQILNDHKCWFGPRIPEPKLTDIQKVNRMNFAYTMLIDQINPEIIGFSDESRFQLDSNRKGVWHHLNKYNPLCVIHLSKYSPSIMIWAMIGKDFKSDLVFVENTVNKDFYLNHIINTNIISDAIKIMGDGFIFQQDGAPPHMTKYNIASIRKQSRIILEWPANSPDLNVIELLWAIIKRRIDSERPNTIDQLKETILRVWEDLSFATINNLIDDFPRRCLLVLKNKGDNIQRFINGGNLQKVTQEEICSVIEDLISEGIVFQRIENLIGEKITESEFLKLTKKKTPRPVVKWTKEKEKIVFLLYKQYGKNYEKIQDNFTEKVTICALKNRIRKIIKEKT